MDPSEFVPRGVSFSLLHFLNIPDNPQISEALDSKSDAHYVVKLTKQSKTYTVEKMSVSNSIDSSYFTTDALEKKKLCYLTSAGEPECEHGSVQRFSVIKMKERCPHVMQSLSLYSHFPKCDMSKQNFEK